MGNWPLSSWQPTAIEVVFADQPAHLDRRPFCFESLEDLGQRIPLRASSVMCRDLYLQRMADHYLKCPNDERGQMNAWMGLCFEAQWRHPWQSTFASLLQDVPNTSLGPGWVCRYLKSRIAEFRRPPLETWTHALPRYIATAQAQLLQESFTHLVPRQACRARL
jgi:hypothetical protein